MKRVVVLGAGFSHAISKQIPLTDELGTLVMKRLDQPHYDFSRGYFEMWLSRLAEPQPDLRDDQNYENYAKFLRIADAVHAVIVERQLQVMNQTPPYWLMRLVGILQAEKTTVLTFNYDTLLEKAVEARRLLDWERGIVVSTEHIINGLPSLVGGSISSADYIESFRLLKLHGSIDSHWHSGDNTGATISRWESLGSWGNPEALDVRRRQRELPGRTPFIVPPAASKSAFYNNPLTRQLWQTAAAALAEAEKVTLVGYSLPPADLVTSGMLAERLTQATTTVEVVNPFPDAVIERLETLGIGAYLTTSIGGSNAINRFVDQLEREASYRELHTLAAEDGNPLLLVAADDSRMSAVIGIEYTEDTIRLITELPSDLNYATRPLHERSEQIKSLNDLRAAIDQSYDAEAVVAALDSRHESRIVDHQELIAHIGPGWVVLLPAAAPTKSIWGWRK